MDLARRAFLPQLAGAMLLPRLALAREEPIQISWPWVRATLQHETMAYMIILNNSALDDELTHVNSPWAEKCWLEKQVWSGLKMRLEEVKSLAVPARSRVELKPNATYLKVRLARAAEKGNTMPFTLTFTKAGRIEISATITNKMLNSKRELI